MTKYDVYSIDPEGCEDADDAFSIYTSDDKLFLAIHIADPTEYININSLLWKDIESKVLTRYPSNTKPIHMIPENIMQKSSLMVNTYGDIKLAITILTQINTETYQPQDKIKLLFTKIKVKKTNALTYKDSSKLYQVNDVLITGLKISESLKNIRGKKTKGIVLNEISNSYAKFDNDKVYLYCDTPVEKLMKQ